MKSGERYVESNDCSTSTLSSNPPKGRMELEFNPVLAEYETVCGLGKPYIHVTSQEGSLSTIPLVELVVVVVVCG